MIIAPALCEALSKMAGLIAAGKSVTVLPRNQLVSTQRAAEMLGMYRPFFSEIIAFREKRDKERAAALDRLTAHAFEAGMWDVDVFPGCRVAG